MKFISCITLILLLSFNLWGQEAKPILDRYMEVREGEQEYQSTVTYKLVRDNQFSRPLEKYSGIEGRWKGVFFQEINKTKIISGEDFSVKLNSDEKAMLVGLSSTKFPKGLNGMDATGFYKFFNQVSLKKEKGTYVISLSEPTLSEVSEFVKIELFIDKETFRLERQVFHYANATDFSIYNGSGGERDLGMAKLVIEYSNYREEVLLNKELFKKEYYFHYDGNKITASPRYKDYELLYAK